MEFLLNTRDYDCYTIDKSTVTPQNSIKFFHQKAETFSKNAFLWFSMVCNFFYYIVANLFWLVVYSLLKENS